jgi:hypothetical protein
MSSIKSCFYLTTEKRKCGLIVLLIYLNITVNLIYKNSPRLVDNLTLKCRFVNENITVCDKCSTKVLKKLGKEKKQPVGADCL